MENTTTLGRSTAVAIATMLACAAPTIAGAQARPVRPLAAPETWSEPQGLVAEPALIERAVIFGDRRLGSGDLSSGMRWGFADLVPGAGSISAQTAYRRWGPNDRYVAEASAGFSMRGYRAVAARFELPGLAQRRLALGTQVRWQDYRQLGYFGPGPRTLETSASQYRLRSGNLAGYVTLRPARWMDLDAGLGVLSPTILRSAGPFKRDRPETSDTFGGDPVFSLAEQPTFVTSGISLTIDTRDFPGHPLRGGVVHVAATRYSDRDGGEASFQRYEADVARFIPVARRRVVFAVHGRLVGSGTDEGHFVPFYLQPSLGGHNSLRSYDDYRFHDRSLLGLSIETRVAMMTHLDVAVFVDAGNVAPRAADLNLDRRSYGAGLRLHSRRQTFARVDVARGAEGWRAVFRLTDPLLLSRLTRRTAEVPFVP
jgi:outer membrane protein assembly factor BamA